MTREEQIEAALRDAMSALDYVRYHYGELYGVGFDRVRDHGDTALAAPPAHDVAGWKAGRDAAEVLCQMEIDRGDRNAQPLYAAGARACRTAIRALTPPAPEAKP